MVKICKCPLCGRDLELIDRLIKTAEAVLNAYQGPIRNVVGHLLDMQDIIEELKKKAE